jgi:hypothetical protein
MQYEKNGVDISGERKQLWKLILKQPQPVKLEFLRFVMSSVIAGAEMPKERTQLWKLALTQPRAVKLEFLRLVARTRREETVLKFKETILKLKTRATKAESLRFVARNRRGKTVLKLKTWLWQDLESKATDAPNPYVISGAEAGFTNILECARMLDLFVSRIKRGELPLSNS